MYYFKMPCQYHGQFQALKGVMKHYWKVQKSILKSFKKERNKYALLKEKAMLKTLFLYSQFRKFIKYLNFFLCTKGLNVPIIT